MGVIKCAKMQFQSKICKFYVRITGNFFLISQNACKAHKNLQFVYKI